MRCYIPFVMRAQVAGFQVTVSGDMTVSRKGMHFFGLEHLHLVLKVDADV